MRILSWNFRAALRWWYPLAILVLSAFIGWRSALLINNLADRTRIAANVWDAFFVAFAGPHFASTTFLEFLRWFVPHVLFLYLWGDVAQGELAQMGQFVLPKVGSRLRWWWGKIVTLMLIVVGYFLANATGVLVGAWTQLPWSWRLSELFNSGTLWNPSKNMSLGVFFALILLVFTTTLFAISVLQITLSVVWRNAALGLLISLLIMFSSWLLGSNHAELVRWLPGSQSMLMRHTLFEPRIHNYSISWSVAYNLVLTSAALGWGAYHVRHMDIR